MKKLLTLLLAAVMVISVFTTVTMAKGGSAKGVYSVAEETAAPGETEAPGLGDLTTSDPGTETTEPDTDTPEPGTETAPPAEPSEPRLWGDVNGDGEDGDGEDLICLKRHILDWDDYIGDMRTGFKGPGCLDPNYNASKLYADVDGDGEAGEGEDLICLKRFILDWDDYIGGFPSTNPNYKGPGCKSDPSVTAPPKITPTPTPPGGSTPTPPSEVTPTPKPPINTGEPIVQNGGFEDGEPGRAPQEREGDRIPGWIVYGPGPSDGWDDNTGSGSQRSKMSHMRTYNITDDARVTDLGPRYKERFAKDTEITPYFDAGSYVLMLTETSPVDQYCSFRIQPRQIITGLEVGVQYELTYWIKTSKTVTGPGPMNYDPISNTCTEYYVGFLLGNVGGDDDTDSVTASDIMEVPWSEGGFTGIDLNDFVSANKAMYDKYGMFPGGRYVDYHGGNSSLSWNCPVPEWTKVTMPFKMKQAYDPTFCVYIRGYQGKPSEGIESEFICIDNIAINVK